MPKGNNISSVVISIHALTRSATNIQPIFPFAVFVFQSTHSQGVRRTKKSNNSLPRIFQSTHSQGVRHCGYFSANLSMSYFYPRTHKECDGSVREKKEENKLFQSTHSQGVRHDLECCLWERERISIHALTRSATNVTIKIN